MTGERLTLMLSISGRLKEQEVNYTRYNRRHDSSLPRSGGLWGPCAAETVCSANDTFRHKMNVVNNASASTELTADVSKRLV